MTIAIGVKVSEGLVLAADSALVVQGDITRPEGRTQHEVLQVYSHATKVTQVLDWPVGTITWGVGQIGSRTIESLVNEYSSTLDEAKRLDVKQIASGLSEFIGERFRNAFPGAEPTLGIQVAGYSPDHFFPEQYILGWGTEQDGEVANVRPDNPDGGPAFGANWYGDAAAIVRLYKGFEPAAIEALVKAGVRKDVADKITRFEYPVVFEAMPLQDAIDFSSWIAQTVIGQARFVVGPATVIGPIDIAVITWERGFQWVQRKRPNVSIERGWRG